MNTFFKEHTVKNEIESWKGFEYSLREETRFLFNKMLSGCSENKDYVKATSSKGESYTAE